MIHWGFFDVNNNIVAVQINNGIITICAIDNVDSPTTKKVITQQTYRMIMQGFISSFYPLRAWFVSLDPGRLAARCAERPDWFSVLRFSPPLSGRVSPFGLARPARGGDSWVVWALRKNPNKIVSKLFPPAEFG